MLYLLLKVPANSDNGTMTIQIYCLLLTMELKYYLLSIIDIIPIFEVRELPLHYKRLRECRLSELIELENTLA